MKKLFTFLPPGWGKLTGYVSYNLTGTGLMMSLLLCSTLAAAQPTLVKDINATQSSELSRHENLISFNGSLFFTAFSPSSGMELWKSDGGEAILVKDITPGSASSTISNLTIVNNTLFFTANTSGSDAQSVELWKTDGTLSGTVIVKDIKPGSAGSSPQNLVNMNGTLFFSADDGVNGRELWKSNGTTEGTTLVKDISLATTNTAPANLTTANSTLFFTIGGQLWKSNGTAAGTLLVKEIGSGSNPGRLTNAGGTLFFTAYETQTTTYHSSEYYDYYTLDGSFQLWKSDGTAAGTSNISTIQQEQSQTYDTYDLGFYPISLASLNNTLFFTVSDNNGNGFTLYKSDGTSAGTTIVKDNISDNAFNYEWNTSPLFTAIGNILYFKSNTVLMRTDGTPAGTFAVKNTDVKLQSITAANGKLYLGGAINQKVQLFQSDGTAGGTSLIKSIDTPVNGTSLERLTYAGSTLFFIAKLDYYVSNGSAGYIPSLWKSNGTEAGTVPVKSINQVTGNAYPVIFGAANGALYFSAGNSTSDKNLWKSNGTPQSTLLVKNIYTAGSENSSSWRTVSNNMLIFNVYYNFQYELWKSNGTEAGTTIFLPDSRSTNARDLIDVNGTLFFDDGWSLYKTDGTASGTINLGSFSQTENYTNVNGILFFTTYNFNSWSLWKSNGTTAGTIKLKDFPFTNYEDGIGNLVNRNGTLYFTANGQLWKSGGTPESTVKIKDIPDIDIQRGIKYLTHVNGTLFFVAQKTAQEGWELWKSDGTEAGTMQVKDINLNGSSSPMHLTNVNGTLFFTAVDDKEEINRELWKSDGTAAGTVRITNLFINQGNYGLNLPIVNLITVSGRLYFTANDGKAGMELWTSDGTAAGTKLVNDLFPGPESALPNQLTNVNGILYFTAHDGKTGIELWKYDPANCVTQPNTNLSLQGSNVCTGQDGKIIIKASQANVQYQAFINNAALGDPVTGGGDITLTIPAVSLTIGNNIISIKANGCVVATLNNTATVTVTATCENLCSATGSILQEKWLNIAGNLVSAIPVNTAPGSSAQITSFETSSNQGDNYGERIRGYLCVPTTGSYTFYIAGDDKCELYLSTDDDPAKKAKIASVSAYTGVRVWNKYSEQKSIALSLVAGKKYYIEALHKEATGGDNLSVGWQTPTQSTISVIPGSALSPYVIQNTGKISREYWANVTGYQISNIPLTTPATTTDQITLFERATNQGDNYGQRFRGYLHPQVSGNYRFFVSGDDKVELYLSTNEDPAKKVKIASVTASTSLRQWNKYASQQSAVVALVAGRKYYIEALHKENSGNDHLSVGWQVPNQTAIAVIAGAYLSPFFASPSTASIARVGVEESLPARISLYPNPFESKLTIATGQAGKLYITVVDNLGRVVYQSAIQASGGGNNLDLAHLKAGIYVFKVSTEDGATQVLKVIKQ